MIRITWIKCVIVLIARNIADIIQMVVKNKTFVFKNWLHQPISPSRRILDTVELLLFCFVLFCFVTATPMAYGVSQARGRIGATAAGLHHSHSNAGSKPHLGLCHSSWQRQILTHWVRPGIEPTTSCFLVRFTSTAPQQELPTLWNFWYTSQLKLTSCQMYPKTSKLLN